MLRALFEAAPLGIGVVGPDGHLTASNRALQRLLRETAAQLQRSRFAERVHPDDRARFNEARAPFELEHRCLRPDGSVLEVRTRASHGVLLVEEAGASADERVAFELGERKKELTALHGTARLLADRGRPLDEVLAQVVRLLPPAFQFPAACSACITLGARRFTSDGHRESPVVLAAKFETAGGARGEAAAFYHSPPLEPGQPPFLPEETPLLRSIAEMLAAEVNRRDTEDSARLERARLDRALAAARMGVWELDVDTNTVTWSEHVARLVGWTGELSGPRGSFAHFTHPEDATIITERVNAMLASKELQQVHFDMRLVKPGGGWQRIHAIASARRDELGKTRRVVAVVADVSRSRALEDDVRQTQKLSVLARVAASVADDLDRVLGRMTASVERLFDALPQEHPDREIALLLREAGLRGVALAGRLRTHGERGDLSATRVDLTNLVTRVLPLLGRLCGERITLEPELEPSCFVYGDPDQIEQVLLNLVVNARDATAGKGTVKLSARTVGAFAALVVEDRGHGIAPELLARISEPFFTTKAAGEGTGLGLSVVFGVAKRCGGRVEVESEPGRGTTFRVLLPKEAPP